VKIALLLSLGLACQTIGLAGDDSPRPSSHQAVVVPLVRVMTISERGDEHDRLCHEVVILCKQLDKTSDLHKAGQLYDLIMQRVIRINQLQNPQLPLK